MLDQEPVPQETFLSGEAMVDAEIIARALGLRPGHYGLRITTPEDEAQSVTIVPESAQ